MTWIFHGRQRNHEISRLHGRALRTVYNDSVPTFHNLQNKDNLFTIHHQNIQSLATEIFKTLDNLPGGTVEDLFTLKTDSYSLRSEQELLIPKVSTVLKGNIHLDILVPLYEIQLQVI